MKKVLFYYSNYCCESSKGGTEVATYRIAKALKDTGEVEVYHAFHNLNSPAQPSFYKEILSLPKTPAKLVDRLSEFIKVHDIDSVVVMSRFFKFNNILKAIKKSHKDVKILFMQHFAPGSEVKKTTFKAGFHLLKLNPFNFIYYLRALFYPVLKLPRTLRWQKIYREVYQNSDKVVILSEGYKKDYWKIAKIEDQEKFVAIPNIFEKSEILKSSRLPKEKRVLILSRMDEIQKRISLALKIWKEIEQDEMLNDWQLDIVGEGHNSDIVKRRVRKLGLKNVTLHGWQKREPFLERSSVLMMTSEYEGLPLSLLEAQLYECVPIAYDSFASLKDIIRDNENGVIVEKFGDIPDYVSKLKKLMLDEEYRKRLSEKSNLNSNLFSSEIIAKKWLKILT